MKNGLQLTVMLWIVASCRCQVMLFAQRCRLTPVGGDVHVYTDAFIDLKLTSRDLSFFHRIHIKYILL